MNDKRIIMPFRYFPEFKIMLNEIKKALYLQKPLAKKGVHTQEDLLLYETVVILNNEKRIVAFDVPISEDFELEEVPAQLLIRWIRVINKNN